MLAFESFEVFSGCPEDFSYYFFLRGMELATGVKSWNMAKQRVAWWGPSGEPPDQSAETCSQPGRLRWTLLVPDLG